VSAPLRCVRPVAAALLAVLLVTAFGDPTRAETGPITELTFAEAGVGTTELQASAGLQEIGRLRIPTDWIQGENGEWIVVELHLDIEFLDDPEAPQLPSDVHERMSVMSFNLNGATFSQLEFSWVSNNLFDQSVPAVAWNSLDLVNGWTEGITFDPHMRMTFVNYPPFAAFGHGDGLLQLSVAHSLYPTLGSVSLSGSSRLIRPTPAPPNLRVGWAQPESMSGGAPIRLPVAVENTGLPARDVIVTAEALGGGVEVLVPAERRLDSVDGLTEITFQVRVTDPEDARVKLGVRGRTGGRTEVIAVLKPRNGEGRHIPTPRGEDLALLIGLLVLASAGLWALAARHSLKGRE
jgi:hypothetical protein